MSEIVYIYVVVSDVDIDHPCRFLDNINIQGKGKQTKHTLKKKGGGGVNECDIKGKYNIILYVVFNIVYIIVFVFVFVHVFYFVKWVLYTCI